MAAEIPLRTLAYMISVEELSFEYPAHGSNVLTDINLRIEPGEHLAIIGATGSGKSTLARCLNGLNLPTSGRVEVDGFESDDSAARVQVRRLVGLVFQNPDDQLICATVEDEIAFGLESLGIAPEIMDRRVEETLESFQLENLRYYPPHRLSGGKKQRVAIAACTAMCPRYLVLDEPSSLLDPRGKRDVYRVISELVSDNLGVIHISQWVEEAVTADRVIVLHEGRLMFDEAPERLFERHGQLRKIGLDVPFAQALRSRLFTTTSSEPSAGGIPELAREIGSRLRSTDPATTTPTATKQQNATPDGPLRPQLVTRDLTFTYTEGGIRGQPALRGIDIDFPKASATAIIGENGSGKTTLAQTLNGLIRPDRGHVALDGVDLWGHHRLLADVNRRIGLVFQFPELQLFAETVYNDVAFGPRNNGLAEHEVEEAVDGALASVHLPRERFGQRSPLSLSYGEKRLVAIAGVLALEPDILVLDEPTAGLSPLAARRLISILRHVVGTRQRTLIFITHNVVIVSELADRIVALRNGVVSLSGPTRECLTHPRFQEMTGMDTPEPVALLRKLAELGANVPADRITLDEVVVLLSPLLDKGMDSD